MASERPIVGPPSPRANFGDGTTRRRERFRRGTVLLDAALDTLFKEDDGSAPEPLHKPKQEKRVRELFDATDTDGIGTLDKDEVAKLAKNLGGSLTHFYSRRLLNDAFAQMDADGDGRVTYEEFRDWWFKWMDQHDNDHCCGAPGLVIHPHYPWRVRWDFFSVALITFSAASDPYKAAYRPARSGHTTLDWVVDAMFWFDMFLSFITGYTVNDHSVELRVRRIVRRYLRSWFLPDFVATFPWDLALGGAGQLGGLIRLVRLVRVLRVLRLGRVLNRVAGLFNVRAALTAITKIIFFIVLYIHIVANLAFIVAGLASDCSGINGTEGLGAPSMYRETGGRVGCHVLGCTQECSGLPREEVMCSNGLAKESWPRTDFTGSDLPHGDNGRDHAKYRHMKSLYFTFTASTTIGFGDMTPKTYGEVQFLILVLITGVFMITINIDIITDLVNGLDANEALYKQRVDELMEYCVDKKTPRTLQQRALQYMSFVKDSKSMGSDGHGESEGASDEGFWELLSHPLKVELLTATYHRHLSAIPVLQQTRTQIRNGDAVVESWISEVAQRMKSAAAAPGDLIVKQGEVGSEIFFLIKGMVHMFSNEDTAVIREDTLARKTTTLGAQEQTPFFGFVEMMVSIVNPMEAEEACAYINVEAANFCELAYHPRVQYIGKEDFVDVMSEPQMEEMMDKLTALAIAQLRKTQAAKKKAAIRAAKKLLLAEAEAEAAAAALKLARAKAALESLENSTSEEEDEFDWGENDDLPPGVVKDNGVADGASGIERMIGKGKRLLAASEAKAKAEAAAKAAEEESKKVRRLEGRIDMRSISLSQQLRSGLRSNWSSGQANPGADRPQQSAGAQSSSPGFSEEITEQAMAVAQQLKSAEFTREQLDVRMGALETHAADAFAAARRQLSAVLEGLQALNAEDLQDGEGGAEEGGAVGGEVEMALPGQAAADPEAATGSPSSARRGGSGDAFEGLLPTPSPPSQAAVVAASPRRRCGAQLDEEEDAASVGLLLDDDDDDDVEEGEEVEVVQVSQQQQQQQQQQEARDTGVDGGNGGAEDEARPVERASTPNPPATKPGAAGNGRRRR